MTKKEDLARLSPLFVVLAWPPGANAPQGLVEHSFSMAFDPDDVRVWWTGKAVDNVFGMAWQTDGRRNAEAQRDSYRSRRPDWRVEAHDLSSDDCPIDIDVDRYLNDLHGTDRYRARNARFTMRESADRVMNTEVVGQVAGAIQGTMAETRR